MSICNMHWKAFFYLFGLFFLSIPIAHGGITMYGSIIDSPCNIDLNDLYQTIDMGSLPITQIARDGKSPQYILTIKLVNCMFNTTQPTKSDYQNFQITFDGEHHENLFKVSGQAKGVGIEIRNEDGNILKPGKPSTPKSLFYGKQFLKYNLRLVADHRPLAAGIFNSQLFFKIDYD